MSPEFPALLLSLLASAVAIGLSPYAALAAIGFASSIDALYLPPTLAGLSAPAVWGTLLGMTAVDALLSRYRLTDLAWNALHTLVKPLAAVLYASAALADLADSNQWLAAVLALAAALLMHVWILAVRTQAWTGGPISWLPGFTPLRLAAAGAMAILAVTAPPFAAAIAAVLVIAPFPWASPLWGAATLALSSVFVTLSRPNRLHNWETGPESLPKSLRSAAELEMGAPLGPSRSTRVTLARSGPRWVYRRGRLVVAHERPAVFVYRQGLRARALRLSLGDGHPDQGALIETVEIDAVPPYSLCLDPAAPEGPAILAELERTASR